MRRPKIYRKPFIQRMDHISFNMPKSFSFAIAKLINKGIYHDKSEFIRIALRELLIKEQAYSNLKMKIDEDQ